ncbi:hypothetical protein QBC38DRAFT_504241 [Podospora fimiseda]|uniref:AA1-like domain-containing protein n=1 Tax=Podospora fimiseda TaxID=252190 RepID=A0AAN7BGN1_9PEZI|nr:hypothetical protein QBC38DRAFT_504241 [Podospora fimiseda]
MRNNIAHLLALGILPTLSLAARNCAASSTTFQYRILEVRYDSPEPTNPNNLSTIAVALGSSTTPIYECVAQWPESWAGWYQGGTNIIWSDCIWTGAGSGADKTVSLAVDWKTKNFYLTHTFDCSDQAGTEGLATGVIPLSIQCSPDPEGSGTTYCTPSPAPNGGRPDIRINTSISPVPSTPSTKTCEAVTSTYQSWSIENWLRSYEIAPGTFTPKKGTDTGPAFSLRSLGSPKGVVLTCVTEEDKDGVFAGGCVSVREAKTNGRFRFDSRLNLLSVDQVWDCGDGTIQDVTGVAYFQATCDRGFNSDLFTCTSTPVWLGTKTV